MKRGTDLLLKFKKLEILLNMRKWQVVGLLQSMWSFTAENAMYGDIGRWSDDDIALGIEYLGDAADLIDALVKTGWLDHSEEHRLVVHDWHEHCEEWVKKRVDRSPTKFVTRGKAGREKGCIYFIQSGEGGHIKIGFTVDPDPKHRIDCVQTGNPIRLIRLGWIRGYEKDERILQKRFAEFRSSGEWFSPAAQLLEFIRDACSSDDSGNNTNNQAAQVHTPMSDSGQPLAGQRRDITYQETADRVTSLSDSVNSAEGGVCPPIPGPYPIPGPNPDYCSGSETESSPTVPEPKLIGKPPVQFDLSQAKFVGITPELRRSWLEAYPAVNLDHALAAAASWVLTNGARGRKSNYARFLNNWLSRSQDEAGQRERAGANVGRGLGPGRLPAPAGKYDEIGTRIETIATSEADFGHARSSANGAAHSCGNGHKATRHGSPSGLR